MLSIHNNLLGYTLRRGLNNSNNILNQAIERMSTGYKVNGAKDNAANYAISTQMTTQLSSLDVAEDNTASGLDLISTANDTLDLINERFTRLRNLAIQAENETYGKDSLKAINLECEALVAEIKNLYTQAEYNGIKIYGDEFFETVVNSATTPIATFSATPTPTPVPLSSSSYATETTTLQELGIDFSSFQIFNSLNELIESYDTVKTDTLGDIFDVLSTYGFTSSITDGVVSITSSNGRYVDGELINALGISLDGTEYVDSTTQASSSNLFYTVTQLANETSTLADLGVLASGSDTVTVKNKYGDTIKTLTVNSSTTLGGLFNSLENYDIQGSIDDGVITLSSSDGNYLVSQGVIANLGIGLVEGSDGVTTGVGQTSGGVVTYETVIVSAGEVITVQEERTTTIWTTTTTPQTVTETIWTTTTTSTTQTNTIYTTTTTPQTITETVWTTTTTSTTQTNTIWTTTTTSQTVTETIWTTTTSSTTRTASIWVEQTNTIWTTTTATTTQTSTELVLETAVTYAMGRDLKFNKSITITDTSTLVPISKASASGLGRGTTDDIDALRSAVNAGIVNPSCVFIMSNDIYITGNIDPIGNNQYSFGATFDGNGYSIYGGSLTLSAATTSGFNGFFNCVVGGTVKNLCLAYQVINVAEHPTAQYYEIGALVGGLYNGTIDNCIVKGNLNALTRANVGGIVGLIMGEESTISNSTFIGDVSLRVGGTESYNVCIGGIVGRIGNTTVLPTVTIENCRALGSLGLGSTSATTTSGIGGIVGSINGRNVSMSSCGFEGYIGNCYSTTGLYGGVHVRDGRPSDGSVAIQDWACAITGSGDTEYYNLYGDENYGSAFDLYINNKYYWYQLPGIAETDTKIYNKYITTFTVTATTTTSSTYTESIYVAKTNTIWTTTTTSTTQTSTQIILDTSACYASENNIPFIGEVTRIDTSNLKRVSEASMAQLRARSTTKICTTEDLDALRIAVYEGRVSPYHVFVLANDLELNGTIEPIGTSVPFQSTFNGNGYTIYGDSLTILPRLGSAAGLFGYVSDGTIKNLAMNYDTIMMRTTSAFLYSGAIVGHTEGKTTIENCTYKGDIVALNGALGGLVGYQEGVANILQCGYIGNIYTNPRASNVAYYIGGIVGYTGVRGTAGKIEGCMVSASLGSSFANTYAASEVYIGGIVGALDGSVSSSRISLNGNYSEIAINNCTESCGTYGLLKTVTVDNTSAYFVTELGEIDSYTPAVGAYDESQYGTSIEYTSFIDGNSNFYKEIITKNTITTTTTTSTTYTETETIYTTTTTSTTETETVWETTTTNSTETETIWSTTTSSATQTSTIYTTTTSSSTATETIWATTTSSTTQTSTIQVTTTSETTQTETVDVTYTTEVGYTTLNQSMTSDTTFAQLGLASRAYVTVINDGTKSVFTIKVADTVGSLVTKLNNSGFTTTLSNGKISITPDKKSLYISGLSSNIQDILALNADFYTTSLGIEMTDSNLFSYDAQKAVNNSTNLSDIGVTSGVLLVQKDGNDYATVAVSSSQTLGSFSQELSALGFSVKCNNGTLQIKSDGDMVLTDSISGSSNMMSVFSLNNITQSVKTTYANTNSSQLSALNEIVNKIWQARGEIKLQVGVGTDENNQIAINTGFTLNLLDEFANIGKNTVNKMDYVAELDKILADISLKQVQLGAFENRLMSAMEEISIKYDNLVSSRSTLRDADIAEETSVYIQAQILQQASATLLFVVANQTPQLALQLL